ncbi:MAG: TonB-dependent receptor domain-containing protein [Pseudomonadales bacterium]
MKSLTFTTAFVSALCAPLAMAEPEIEQTIVTGTRTLQPVFESLSAATVIDRATIETTQARNLFGLLARVPGTTFVRNGGRGASTSLFLRGNQSGHSLFLVDGIRVGSATLGSTSLQHFNVDLIDRIEIVRGPKSSLYGSDAIGGVINIITRKGSNAVPLSIEAGYGTDNTQEQTLVSGFDANGHNVNLVLGYQYTKGTDNTESADRTNGDDDAYRNTSVALNYRFQPSDNVGAGVSYQTNKAEVEYDTECTETTFFADVECSPFSKDEGTALSGDIFAKPFEAWRTSLRVGHSIDDSQNRADEIDLDTTFSGGDFKTTKQEATWQNDISFATNQLVTLGVEYVKDKVSGTTNYDVDSRDNTALFAQLQLAFAPVDVLLGARNDDNEQFGSETTFDAGLGFALTDNLRLNASYGQGFKAPTFNDLYFPDFGNPDLVPEESDNYDLELRGNFESSEFSVALYHNDLENLIQFNSAIGAADQTAEARIKGIEASVSTLYHGWQFAITANVLDTEDKATAENLPRIPEKTLHFDVDKDFGSFSLGLSVHAESSRFDDPGNTDKLRGFATVDLRTAYAISDRWQLKLKLDNIFDRDYTTAKDFSLGRYVQPGFEALFSVVYTPKL